MQNTDQPDSTPSPSPDNQPPTENESKNEAKVEDGADVPFTDEQEEAQFIAVNGGPSGRLHTPEEAAEERSIALEEVQDRVRIALHEFREVTKQSHTVDRLLGSLTPTASMGERLPFTPVANLHLTSQNRDDHILHLAGLVILTWGILARDDAKWAGDLDELRARVTRLEAVTHDRRQFKPYPVDPRSSLFVLRRITEQAELNRAAESRESERAERLSDFPRQTD